MKKLLGIIPVTAVLFLGCNHSVQNKTGQQENSNSLIIKIENMNTFNDLIKGEQPVLVDFYADWCAPCRMMAPVLEKLAIDMQGKVKILKVNVDKNQDAAMKYGIRNIPTLILFQKGEVRWQGVGVQQADQIKQAIISKT
jgi:thioredoxin 1